MNGDLVNIGIRTVLDLKQNFIWCGCVIVQDHSVADQHWFFFIVVDQHCFYFFLFLRIRIHELG